MHYFLAPLHRPEGCRLKLSKARYKDIVRCRDNLVRVVEIEETFDGVVGNYAEFQGELLRLSVWHSVRGGADRSQVDSERRLVNRRLGNLLSSCRLYVDQTPRLLGEAFPDGAAKSRFKEAARQEYDSSFSYRLIDGIRNYAQHRGFVAQWYSWRWWTTDLKPQAKTAVAVHPKIVTEDLLRDKQVKASLRNQLRELDDTIDLAPHVRSYVQSLSGIHRQVRLAIEPQLDEWEERVVGAVEEFRVHSPEDYQEPPPVSAYRTPAAGGDPLETTITISLPERIAELQAMNPTRKVLPHPLPGCYFHQDSDES